MHDPDTDHLAVSIARMAQARVLCIGDIMIDTFNTGSIGRISPESPVPVFCSGTVTSMPGGAANVARNIAALGGLCVLVGAVGDDQPAAELARELNGIEAITAVLLTDQQRQTTQKVRFVAQGQHVLRVDSETIAPIGAEVEAQLIAAVRKALPVCDAVVLSDYAKGVLTDRVIAESTTLARAQGLPVIVDPKSLDFSRYRGATILTPNLKEASAALGREMADDAAVTTGAQELIEAADIDALLITRSEAGMTLCRRDGSAEHFRADAREVYDVVGAGDTVIATLALGLATGLSAKHSTELANVAAGIAVGKRGTATVAPEELIDRLEFLRAGPQRRGAPLLLSAEEARRYAVARRAEGKRVGFTNGVFDIVHPGHISLLDFARDACDCLIVGLNSDASVRRLGKGTERPINPELDRAAVLGAFGSVEAVVIFDEDTPMSLIEAIRPDVLVKGSDYSVAEVVGATQVKSWGGEVRLAPIVTGKSSTNIIRRAKLDAAEPQGDTEQKAAQDA